MAKRALRARAKPEKKEDKKEERKDDNKEDKDDVYDVERIVDKKTTSSGVEYYVKWKGYSALNNSWEPAENILCQDLIDKFENGKVTKRPRKEVPKKALKEAAEENVDEANNESGDEKSQESTEKTGKRALEEEEVQEEVAEPPETIDLGKVKKFRLINESNTSKSVTLQGTYLNKPLVVKLDRPALDEGVVPVLKDMKSDLTFYNDVYSTYTLKGNFGHLSDLKATMVWPASDSAVEKYTKTEKIFFSENPETYTRVVEPFIKAKITGEKDYSKWIYNILEGSAEKERVFFNDEDSDSGFILSMDLNWDGNEKSPVVLAICHRRDIRSLRDLTNEHSTLLQNIMTKGTKAVKDKFKKMKGQLRSYVHYQPSFYHFHVHFRAEDPNDYVATDRDNLLSNIINNITMNKDYYKKSTLTYPLAVNSSLYKELKKAKKV